MRTIIIIFSLFMLQPVFAVENSVVEYHPTYEQPANTGSAADLPTDIKMMRVQNEFWYIVLLCSLCVVSLTVVLYFLKHNEHSAKDMVNATGLTLIIFGTIILVLVVSTSEQLTAAIGILGAIAGYLFRSAQDNNQDKVGQ